MHKDAALSSFRCCKHVERKDPALSVLVRVKNEIAALPTFWNYLTKQTAFDRVEVLFLDSGSSDGSLEFLLSQQASVYTLAPKEFSFGTSCNQLMEVACAPLAMMLSAHVFLPQENCLEQLIDSLTVALPEAAYLRQVPNPLLGSNAYERAYLNRRFPALRDQTKVSLSEPRGFSNAASVLTRVAWERQPFPDVIASEDHLWALALLHAGGRLFYLPSLIAEHSHNESPTSVTKRVRINAEARHATGSPLRFALHFSRVFAAIVLTGGGVKEASTYAKAHAKAYL